MKRLGKPMSWLFVPIGIMVGFAVQDQPIGMTVFIVVVFGMVCTFVGCFLAVAHANQQHKAEADALTTLRAQYDNALQSHLISMRKALIALTARALRSAAGKMVNEFLPSFDNDEQYEAAIASATVIVVAELDTIADLVGIKTVTEEVTQDSGTQDDVTRS